MLNPEMFCAELQRHHISFFCGVPDSLLKYFCYVLQKKESECRCIVTANEGNAVALAAGHFIASGEIPCVFMQNSGLGNAINPLLSLADPEVYSIPILILVGWRGRPGVHDEPQHARQGELTLPLIRTMKYPFAILPQEEANVKTCLNRLLGKIRKKSSPGFLLIRENTFFPVEPPAEQSAVNVSREEMLENLLEVLSPDVFFVSTTGKLSRELWELRERKRQTHSHDFLVVGSMGHASQIALSLSLAKPGKPVVCLDGDGALLMHMGALAINGQNAPDNFTHVVFNNGMHESVGLVPTAAARIDLPAIAKACGYKTAHQIRTESELFQLFQTVPSLKGPHFVEILTNAASRKNLGRPTESPRANLQKIYSALQQPETNHRQRSLRQDLPGNAGQ